MDPLPKYEKDYMIEQLRNIASRIETDRTCEDEIVRIRRFLLEQLSHKSDNKEFVNALFLGFYIQRISRNNLGEQ
jgi:hypothetical protein